jgi:hypothetical protein
MGEMGKRGTINSSDRRCNQVQIVRAAPRSMPIISEFATEPFDPHHLIRSTCCALRHPEKRRLLTCCFK